MKKLVAKLIILLSVPSYLSCAQQNGKHAQQQSLQEFWTAFRGAVLAGDKNKIASMYKFPFETKGTSDDDPVRS